MMAQNLTKFVDKEGWLDLTKLKPKKRAKLDEKKDDFEPTGEKEYHDESEDCLYSEEE